MPQLQAQYFDGHSAQARAVRLQVQGGLLQIEGDEGLLLQVPVAQVAWPERQRHGARQAQLPGHGLLTHADAAAWDAWAAASGLGDSLVVRAMQSWRGTLLAALLLVAALWGGWAWGVPLVARGVAATLPATVDEQLGDAVMAQLDQQWLQPSRLSAEQQAQARQHWQAAVARWAASPGSPPVPAWNLQFRRMPHPAEQAQRGKPPAQGGAAGHPAPTDGLANALALPGGTIILTDALVRLLADRPDVLVGVLGHELGHLQQRHGLRMLVQAGLLAGAATLLVGDVSQLLAAAPVWLGQAAYSRAFEFEADDAAAALLRANGHDPAVLGVLFERLRQAKGRAAGAAGAASAPAVPSHQDDEEDTGWGIGLASHPPDAERLRRLSRRP